MATKEAATADPVFSKAQLLASQKYADRRDLLNVLLADDKQYNFADVDQLINKFFKTEFHKSKDEGVK